LNGEDSVLPNSVFVCKTSPRTLKKDIKRALEGSEFINYYLKERKTLIKINANYDRKYPGCNTSTWFLNNLLKVLKEMEFADLAVVEGDLKLQPALRTIGAIGIKKVLSENGVPFIPIEDFPRKHEIPRLVLDAQVINAPVIHTHTFATFSCAFKNLFGLLPVYREKYHNELSKKLLELGRLIQPCFTIVDGTVGLDGGSMRMGNPRRLDLLLAGWNLAAIDTVAAKIMSFSIDDVPLLKLAQEENATDNIVSVKGDYTWEELPSYHFKYKSSMLAQLDLYLRGNLATKKLFEFNSILDISAQYLRRFYLSVAFHLKKKGLYKCSWMEYAENA
jgi:uncharacterized protein (DUF362 family)